MERMLAVQFVDRAHDLCQRLVEWFGRINDAALIIELLKARFPLLPFLPRSNLELGNLPFPTLKPAFLHFWWTLAMNNQQGSMKSSRQFLRLFKRRPICERGIYHNTQAQSKLFSRQVKHDFIRKLPDARQIPNYIHCHLAN